MMRRHKTFRVLMNVSLIFGLFTGLFFYFVVPNRFVHVKDMTHYLGDPKIDIQAHIEVKNRLNQTKIVKITLDEQHIDWNNEGVYPVFFSYQYAFKTIKNTFNIYIFGIPPIICAPDERTYYIKDDLPNFYEDVIVVDRFNQNLINDLVIHDTFIDFNKPGVYPLDYEVTDAFGLTTTFKSKLYVIYEATRDYTPHFLNVYEVIHPIGMSLDAFEHGVDAIDYDMNDITHLIMIDFKELNIYKTGVYDVSLKVICSNGFEKEITIKVHIVDLYDMYKPQIIYTKDMHIDLGLPNVDFSCFVYAIDYDHKDITHLLKIDDSNVNLNIEGSYEVIYFVKNAMGISHTVKAKLHVRLPIIDVTPPTFSGLTPVVYQVGDQLPDLLEGVYAHDDTDGDITHLITFNDHLVSYEVIGIYEIIYEVLDQALNKTIAYRTIEVIDLIPPVFYNLKDIMYIIGDQTPNFLDGIVAIDNYDLDITHLILVFGDESIDYEKEGSYLVRYEVRDSSSNLSVSVITVYVLTYATT